MKWQAYFPEDYSSCCRFLLIDSCRNKEVPELLAKVNPQAIFVDGRRMLDKHSFSNYEGIGV